MSQVIANLDEITKAKEILENSIKTMDKTNTVLHRELQDMLRQFKSLESNIGAMADFLSDNGKKLSSANEKIVSDLAKTYKKHSEEIDNLEREKSRIEGLYKADIISKQDHDDEQKAIKKEVNRYKADRIRILNEIETAIGVNNIDGKIVEKYGQSELHRENTMKQWNENIKNEKEVVRGRKELEKERKREKRERKDKESKWNDVSKALGKVGNVANSVGNVYNNLDKNPIDAIAGGANSLIDGAEGLISLIPGAGPFAKAAGMISKAVVGAVATVMKMYTERDGIMHKMIGIMGLSGRQLEAYKNKTNFITQSIAKNWGKSLEDIVGAQIKYQEATGKSILLSEDMLNSHFALSKVVGDENASGFTAGMEYFNYTVKDSADLYYELYKNASKMGLNTQKMTKDMVENLKLAQKYNFKGGVQNMLEMTLLAQKIGMSLSTVTSVAEKIIEGGLQGAIEQSAQLQVLGGQRAYMANPLSMLHESFTNVGDLMTRISKMTEGLGRWDQKTRQMRYDNVVDEQMIRQVAKVLGITSEEIKTTRNTQMRRRDIEEYLKKTGAKFSEELTESVKNKAIYNQKLGTYEVTTVTGHRIGVDQLREGDEKYLVANPEGSTIEEFAKANMSMNDTLTNSVTALKNGFGMLVYDNFGEMVMKGLDVIAGGLDFFTVKQQEEHKVEGAKSVRELTQREKQFARLQKANERASNSQLSLFGSNPSLRYDPSTMTYHEGFVEHKYRSERDSIRVAREKMMRDTTNRMNMDRYTSDSYSIYDANSSSMSYHEARDSRMNFEREMLRSINNTTTTNGGMDINMNGTIKLEGGDQSMDITEVLRRNPNVMRQVANGVVDQMGRSVNGGRSELFPSDGMRRIYR